jgi:hypothetical protein
MSIYVYAAILDDAGRAGTTELNFRDIDGQLQRNSCELDIRIIIHLYIYISGNIK